MLSDHDPVSGVTVMYGNPRWKVGKAGMIRHLLREVQRLEHQPRVVVVGSDDSILREFPQAICVRDLAHLSALRFPAATCATASIG